MVGHSTTPKRRQGRWLGASQKVRIPEEDAKTPLVELVAISKLHKLLTDPYYFSLEYWVRLTTLVLAVGMKQFASVDRMNCLGCPMILSKRENYNQVTPELATHRFILKQSGRDHLRTAWPEKRGGNRMFKGAIKSAATQLEQAEVPKVWRPTSK